MQPLLYGELVPWYALLDPPEDHETECAAYVAALQRAIEGPRETLLELGAGAGNNGRYLEQAFRCTLSDLSPPMLALSRAQNPECEHVLGDMRTLRLGRTFDAVVIHDAIMYMLTEADLAAAIATAYAHTRPGGAALLLPDCTRETATEYTLLHQGDEGTRSMRCIEWCWDPDPHDSTMLAELSFLLRDGTELRAVHDRHELGVFPRATWVRCCEEIGFVVEHFRVDGDCFLARRPA